MEINKRGQSEFVAYAILVGLAVTLATIVGIWSFNNSQKLSDNVVRQGAIQEKCDEISINGFVICPMTNPIKINIINTGSFTLSEVKITNVDDGKECNDASNKITDLKPNQQVTKTLNNCNTAILLPFVKILDDESIGCSEKKLVLKLVC